jgi:hypothetical protein
MAFGGLASCGLLFMGLAVLMLPLVVFKVCVCVCARV